MPSLTSIQIPLTHKQKTQTKRKKTNESGVSGALITVIFFLDFYFFCDSDVACRVKQDSSLDVLLQSCDPL